MKHWYLVLIFIYFGFLAGYFPAQAQGSSINAGFVSGIWYSNASFFAGDDVRIYSAIQNQSGFDITGTVQFFDNAILIGKSEFSAIDGRLVEAWTDWKATQGRHNIHVKIVNAKKSEAGKEPQPITLTFDLSMAEERFVDIDTDRDELGNADDLDDDNDGLVDDVELALGTDPLNEDSDADGIMDGDDPSPLEQESKLAVDGALSEAERTGHEGQFSEIAGGAAEIVREIAQSAAENIIPFVHETADKLGEKAEIRSEKIREELKMFSSSKMTADSSADVPAVSGEGTKKLLALDKKKVLLKIQLAALSGASMALKYKVLLWGFLLLFLFIAIKLILRFRNK